MAGNTQPVTTDNVDPNRAILVDGQSLLTLATLRRGARLIQIPTPHVALGWVRGNHAPSLNEGAEAFWNLIQNIVIYDELLVDSVLLFVDEECHAITESFPGVFKALKIAPHVRQSLVQELIPRFSPQTMLENFVKNANIGPPPDGERNPLEDLSEEMQEDWESRAYFEGAQVVNDQISEIRAIAERARNYGYGGVPSEFMTTVGSVFRAHFYLELSRLLGLYYSPHPTRAAYYKTLTTLAVGAPQAIVSEFDESMKKSEAVGAKFSAHLRHVGLTFDLPPVAEWVLDRATRGGLSIADATLELRNSRNAIRFRQWCGDLATSLRGGRAEIGARQEAVAELEAATADWTKDIDEGRLYRTRKLSIGKIIEAIASAAELADPVGPGKAAEVVGKVIDATGDVATIKIRDPILGSLWSKRPYLYFLNDLYRPPPA